MIFHLVPPHYNIIITAEKAIQTFKNNLASILCGVDDNLPMHLWYPLLQQAKLTLNLIRQPILVPTISSYAHLYVIHD